MRELNEFQDQQVKPNAERQQVSSVRHVNRPRIIDCQSCVCISIVLQTISTAYRNQRESLVAKE